MQLARNRSATRLLLNLGLVVLASVGLLGCPSETVEPDGETGGLPSLLPGDLVITEIVANPLGTDKGQEWFEIYNATSEMIDLDGLLLVKDNKVHEIARSVEVQPGGYVVVGSILDEVAENSEHIDYGYGEELGELGNGGGYLAIETDEIIDEVDAYPPASAEASHVLSGSQAPDALANNNPEDWCESSTVFVEGYAATPGAVNDACATAQTCMQDGETIPIVHPQVGELIITEAMPNPGPAEDELFEWFELHSLAQADFHLNGLDLGRKVEDGVQDTITRVDCITLTPDAYAIVAKSPEPMENGGLPAEAIVWIADPTIDLTLDGALWVGVAGEVVDAMTWTGPTMGATRQLRAGAFDPIANDDEANWCDATEPYGDGDLGTPGAENTSCPLPPPPEGSCYENGELREIVEVPMGGLELTEIMANPANDGGEAPFEWFEVLANGDGDLNGLEITKEGVTSPIEFEGECVTVSAGEYIVFAHDLGANSEVDVLFDAPTSLTNSNSDLGIGYGGMLWEPITTWASLSDGVAWSKDIDTDVWCDAVDPYDAVINYGTPGQPNPPCGGGNPDGCIDPDTLLMRNFDPPLITEITLTEVMPNPSLPEQASEWFEIHASAAFDLNGLEIGKNNVFEDPIASEMCIEVAADSYVVFARSDMPDANCMLPFDFLYSGPGLTNGGDNLQIAHGGQVLSEYTWGQSSDGVAFSYDAMSMTWCDAVDVFGCGDLATPGVANPACGVPGQCYDPIMDVMRDPVVPELGDLVITEFMANPDPTPDADGEWFEVRALGSFDLHGLRVGKDYVGEGDNPLHVISNDANECLPMVPNDVALLALNGDAMINGGLPAVDYVFSGFGLTNGASGLYIASDFELLDEIFWSATGIDRSTSLDPDSYDPALNDTANNALPWCYMTVGQETPGEDNLQCP
jgi:hypothetical protein